MPFWARYSTLSVLVTTCRLVPGTGANSGGPAVTISSAGISETMISAGGEAGLAGMACRASASAGSAGRLRNVAGTAVVGTQGPIGSAAVYQAPFASRKAGPSALSSSTVQFVLIARCSVLPATGASTGGPSNTTRLAGAERARMRGGALLTATGFATASVRPGLSRIVSSGKCFSGSAATAERIFCSTSAARLMSSVGKCEPMSARWEIVTSRSARSTAVSPSSSIVPRNGLPAFLGVIATAARTEMRFCSGQDSTCGW